MSIEYFANLCCGRVSACWGTRRQINLYVERAFQQDEAHHCVGRQARVFFLHQLRSLAV